MNGQESKLIFRFDTESEQVYHQLPQDSQDDRSTMTLSTNPSRLSHYLPEGIVVVGAGHHDIPGNSAEEMATPKVQSYKAFLLNLFRLANLLSSLFLCTFLLTRVYSLPREATIFETLRFFSTADFTGTVLGIGCYMLVGFRKSMTLNLLLLTVCVTAMMYIEDRNAEYSSLVRVPAAQRLMAEEARQFTNLITTLVFSTKTLLAACTIIHFLCIFSKRNAFPGHLKASSIGFIHIMPASVLPMASEFFLDYSRSEAQRGSLGPVIDPLLAQLRTKPLPIILATLLLSLVNMVSFSVWPLGTSGKSFSQ